MAKKPTTRKTRVFSISFPEDLALQVDAVAKAESRTTSELFREAFRGYRMDQMRGRLAEIRADAAKRVAQRYIEDDVEAIVDEIRSESFNERKTA